MEAIRFEKSDACDWVDHYYPVIKETDKDYSGEYYPKAEADAEIERLEAENAALRQNVLDWRTVADARSAEISKLRERLARLVEAAKRFYEAGWTQRGFEDCLQKLEMAIDEAEKK